MASRAISGRPGGGKSFYAVKLLLRLLFDDDRPIVTNLPLRLDNILKYCFSKGRDDIEVYSRILILDDDQVPDFWRYRGVNRPVLPACANDRWKLGERPAFEQVKGGVVYFLDEVHDFLNSRNWQTTGNACLYYISKHRHLGDDVFWITQSIKNVDNQFRSVTQDYTYCRNYGKEMYKGWSKGKYFTATTYLEPITSSAVRPDPQESEKFKMESDIGACYYTSKQRLSADVGVVTKGHSVKWLFVGIGVLTLLACLVLWFGPQKLVGHFLKPIRDKERLVAPGGVPAPVPQASPKGLLAAPLDTPDLRQKEKEMFSLAVILQNITAPELLLALQGRPSVGDVFVSASPFGNAVVVTGTSFQNVLATTESIRSLDAHRPAMVMLQAVILRTNKGRSSNVGVWKTLQEVVADGGFGFGEMAFDPVAGVVTFGSITAAQEVVRIMGSQNVGRYGFTVESRPVLAATSGQEAWFTSGREVPVPVTTQNVSNSQSSILYKKVQFSFGVTPSVLPSGRIALRIVQNNDDVIGSSEVGGNTVPTIATQSLSTRIELQEGQVAVLGGVSLRNEGDDSNSFPVLGAVPPFSWIFGNRDKRREESELLVVITAFRVPDGANPLPVRRAEAVKKISDKKETARIGNPQKKQEKKGKIQ
ncbi:MAG: zonular occludens toxin domain-containing protein [Terrimicrobiaceae bacterium]